jgi:hypothetical protein
VADLAITMPRLIALATAAQPTIPERYVGKPRDMVTAIWLGREMGLQPMTSIMELYLVNGSVGMSGKSMSALIHSKGHILRVELGEEEVIVHCSRWHEPSKQLIEVGTVSFTKEDAKRAGLWNQDTYQSYPQQMLAWRAISRAARIYYADVLMGVSYVPEEVGYDLDIDEVEALPEGIVEGELVDDDVTKEESDG